MRWLFPALAYHLAGYNEDFSCHISDALEANPGVLGHHIHAQFKLLITVPLQPLMEEGTSILIVIDMLDECDEDDAATVLSILAHNIQSMCPLKVFITACPELHIQVALDQYQDDEQFHMQDIEQFVVEAGIQLNCDYPLYQENYVLYTKGIILKLATAFLGVKSQRAKSLKGDSPMLTRPY